MKRLLTGLLLLALALPAAAKVAVVTGVTGQKANETWGAYDVETGAWCDAQMLALLRLYDSDIVTVPANHADVYALKDGYVVHPVSGDTTTVDAVIWARAVKTKGGLDNYGTCRPQALTFCDTIPTVPQLLIMDQTPGTDFDLGVGFWRDYAMTSYALRCSIGAGNQVDYLDPGTNAPSEGRGGWVYGLPYHWMWPGTMGWALPINATRPAGGLRKLLGTFASKYGVLADSGMTADPLAYSGTYSDDYYGIMRFADMDTCIAWERLNSHKSGAARVIAMPMVYGTNGEVSEFYFKSHNDPLIPFMMLAHLDSLAGGDVLGADAEPLQVAVVIDGAFARAGSGSSYGIAASDSAALKTSLDSLAAYGIKVTVAAQLDSVASYPYEKAWWAKLTHARYAPQAWTGVRDSTGAGVGNAEQDNLVDIFGHLRVRNYYGAGGAADSDSTVFALVRHALNRNRATWGARASSFIVPPAGDWVAPGMRPDSTAIAIRLAGASGLLTCSGDTLARGWKVGPGYYHGLKVLPYAATFTVGSELMVWASVDPADVDTLGTREVLSAFWSSLLFPAARMLENSGSDRQPGSQHSRPWPRRACVLYLPAQSLAGAAAGSSIEGQPTGNPLKPGLWTLISIIQQVQAINHLAGRTLIEFAYPEDIRP